MCRVRGTCPAGLLSVGLCRRDIVRRETPHRAYFRHARAITRWHAEIISTVSFSIPSRKRAIHFVTQQQQQQQQQQHTHTRTVTDTRMSWFVRKILTKKKKKNFAMHINHTFQSTIEERGVGKQMKIRSRGASMVSCRWRACIVKCVRVSVRACTRYKPGQIL